MTCKPQSKTRRLAKISSAVTALLVAWTAFIASLETQYWFGYSWMHQAWIAFDIGLVLAFLALTLSIAYRHRAARTLAPALLGVIIADWTISALMWHAQESAISATTALLVAAFALTSTCALGYFLLRVEQHAISWDRNT